MKNIVDFVPVLSYHFLWLVNLFIILKVFIYPHIFSFMDNNSEYKLDPSPFEPSVLTEQLIHRSQDI